MILQSPEDLQPFVRDLLPELPAGSLLLLDGPMGAGKTTLVQALAKELGSEAAVSSPTYTLIHEYPTPVGTLVHIDVWRLGQASDLIDSGLDEYLDHARLVVVEWGAELAGHYPAATVISLAVNSDGSRTLRMSGKS